MKFSLNYTNAMSNLTNQLVSPFILQRKTSIEKGKATSDEEKRNLWRLFEKNLGTRYSKKGCTKLRRNKRATKPIKPVFGNGCEQIKNTTTVSVHQLAFWLAWANWWELIGRLPWIKAESGSGESARHGPITLWKLQPIWRCKNTLGNGFYSQHIDTVWVEGHE